MFGRKKNVDLDLEEKQQTRPESQGSSNGAGVNMVVSKTKYEHKEETAHEAAERGVVATDQYGIPLVIIDKKAEAKLLLKIDLMVVPTVSLLYLFCFIDRANIGNARLAGFEKDLGLIGYDYNIVLSVFYISYIVFEIPSNIACKWMGPGYYIPLITLLFGVCSLATAFVTNKAEACGVRFVLGIFEAGMMPGIAYYLSRWYRTAELTFRLGLYIVMAPLAGAFGGLLASGILKLDHVGGTHTWQMIFVIEGIVTIALSVIAFFTLTDRPETARWLNQEEKDLAIARVKSERVAQTEVLDTLDGAKTFNGIFSPITIWTGFIFLLNNVTVQGLAFFMPTIIATIYPNESTTTKQLKTVPPYIVGAFFVVLFPFMSWRFDRRIIFMIILAPLMIIGYIIFVATGTDQGLTRYGATFIIAAGAFAFGPLTNGCVSANAVSDTARASAIGTNMMLGNVGGLIATWSFLPDDAPNYLTGNAINLATSSTMLCLLIAMWFYMKWDNRRRESRDVDSELSDKSDQEIQDMEWKHPAFRWKP